MSEVQLTRPVPDVTERDAPPRNWAGALTRAGECATYYLHLMAVPCEKCQGPVLAGWIGRREDELTRETKITGIGTICVLCGARPEALIDPLAARHFRPIEWEWNANNKAQAMVADAGPLASGLPHNADPK
jgi:hypothetical protein